MTITEGSAGADGTAATAGGGIDRLNAFDGLFLRAEHLNRIQDYARELALAVGEAGGPGVVEGYEVTLRDGTLRVGGGLAVTAGGRPLRSQRLVTLPLSGLRPGPDTFWWVEAVPEAWPYGEAPVQGAYCDDPCSGAGTTRQPYTAEGVRIRLTEATERGLDQRAPELRRNWLASRLFAAERTGHSPWPYGTAAADLPRSWAPPGTAGKPEAVRLAVLLPHPAGLDAWEADIWAARRDRGAAPPQREWQARLGMRPWDVFVAQILQFQAHLAQLVEAPAQRSESDLAPLLEQLARIGKQTFLQSHTKDQLGRELAQLVEGIDAGELIASAPVRQGPYSLVRMGIGELPPAGYLPVWGGDGEERPALDQVRTWLEPCRDLRWCTGAPADVAQAVQEAQHRDRIPLDGSADVDVLVPVDEEGEPLTRWVAFVRRDRRRCREPREEDGPYAARHPDGGGAQEPGEARAEPGSGAGATDPETAG
ncbi:hypothetical protein [Streptomyces sp. NBC_01408]|uniref:hypothetical protein n=1 Tax=Streptomyces sp. NBC_01408 TaxID=2903855 RepID=UPI0022525B6B|nr:hypothetical protein [Streptomyces sp. NBC_01408]MCX4695756.1 hypothetical protein [Streptomyces sp. NBC_01408]